MEPLSYTVAFQRAEKQQLDRKLRQGSDIITALADQDASTNFTVFAADPTKDSRLGTLHRLADKADVDPDSIVFQQDCVNDAAFNHPAMPIASALSPVGKKVYFCCPVSSFGGKYITQKWQYLARKAPWQMLEASSPLNSWIPIQGNGHDTGALKDWMLHEELCLVKGQLAKKTYVNLDQGFWIEANELAFWSPRKGMQQVLTPASLSALQWAYAVAEKYRETDGNPSKVKSRSPSPTPSPPATPPQYVPATPAADPIWGMQAYEIPYQGHYLPDESFYSMYSGKGLQPISHGVRARSSPLDIGLISS